MPKFKIPLQWTMGGTLYITADTLEEAIEQAFDSETPLPTHNEWYMDDSFKVIEEECEEMK